MGTALVSQEILLPIARKIVAVVKFPRIHSRSSIMEQLYFLRNTSAFSKFCHSQVRVNASSINSQLAWYCS